MEVARDDHVDDPELLQMMLDLNKDGQMRWPKGLTPQIAKEFLELTTRAGRCSSAGKATDVLFSMKCALSCPLTGELMVNPFLCTRDGMTYEKAAIEGLIRDDLRESRIGPDGITGCTSPISEGRIKTTDLTPNHVVRMLVKLIKAVEKRMEAPSVEEVNDAGKGLDEQGASAEAGLGAFMCPITLGEMRHPVLTKSGHTYERDAIEKYVAAQGKSPQTRVRLSVSDLKPNYSLKAAISEVRQGAANTKEQIDKQAQEKSRLLRELFTLQHKFYQMDLKEAKTPPRKRRRLLRADTV